MERPNSAMGRGLRKMLDCSTAHLRESTREILDSATLDESTLPAMRGMFGWLVWVPNNDDDDDDVDTPEDLRHVLTWARKLGCEYVLFDSDGPIFTELETFE